MALTSKSRSDLEYRKFVQYGSNDVPLVRVALFGATDGLEPNVVTVNSVNRLCVDTEISNVTVSGDVYVQNIKTGQYNATLPTLSDTNQTLLQTNANGILLVSTVGSAASVSTTTLTWTEQVIANGVAPDTDTATTVTGAKSIYIQFNTNGANTGSPNFDLHVIASHDGTTYTDTGIVVPFSAQAKDVVDGAIISFGPKSIKLRLDVNTANLAAGESVTASIYVTF